MQYVFISEQVVYTHRHTHMPALITHLSIITKVCLVCCSDASRITVKRSRAVTRSPALPPACTPRQTGGGTRSLLPPAYPTRYDCHVVFSCPGHAVTLAAPLPEEERSSRFRYACVVSNIVILQRLINTFSFVIY